MGAGCNFKDSRESWNGAGGSFTDTREFVLGGENFETIWKNKMSCANVDIDDDGGNDDSNDDDDGGNDNGSDNGSSD